MDKNTLYTGDNLYVMNGMNSETVDLIYLDPPFNSKRTYSAPIGSKAAGTSFNDIWTWQDVDKAYLDRLYTTYPAMVGFIDSVATIHSKGMASYLCFMAQRILEMHCILKKTGSFYLHVDPTASHYLKIICDRVFGRNEFFNEVIWHYGKWTNAANHFQKNHDVLLVYCKSKGRHIFNKQFNDDAPQKEKYKKGWDSNVVQNGIRQLIVYDAEKADRKIKSQNYDKIVYREGKTSVAFPDVWDISVINSQAKERTGYPTQKPLKLLYQIIQASSNEGDVVFDPFCGCATTMVAAQQLGRKWIGIDIEAKAAALVAERLQGDAGLFTDFIHRDALPVRTDVTIVLPTKQSIKERLHKGQEELCNGCRHAYNIKDFEVDHIIPKSKGGQDVYENFQLRCGNCNRIKGDRPNDYLMAKINTQMAAMQYVSFTDSKD